MARLARPAALVLLALAACVAVWRFVDREPGADAPGDRPSEQAPEVEPLGAPTLRGLPGAAPLQQRPRPTDSVADVPAKLPSRWLRIDVVDALTGRDAPATWNMGTGQVVAGPFSPGQLTDDEAFARAAAGVERSIAEWEARFLAAGIARADYYRGDQYATDMPLTVRPPLGHVLLAPPTRVTATLAADTEGVVAVVPVIREAVLEVSVVGPDGQDAPGASLTNVTLGGTPWPVNVVPWGPGRSRVYGLPHLAGAVVEAAVDWPAPEGTETEEVPPQPVPGEDPRALHALVPESLALPWLVEVRLPGRTNTLRGHEETDNDLPFLESLGEVAGPTDPQGRLRIRLLDRQGRPGVGAPTFDLELDGKGEVLVEGLKPGRVQHLLALPGQLPIRLDAEVRANEETLVSLREPQGGRLEVTVVDAEGRPRPTALLEIRGRVFFDVEGTTQRVDLFTDHLGRRSIARVEPGQAEVHASWGGRHGFEKVTVIDGETTRVRIVAR